MDKTIEILEKSIKFAKKQIIDRWDEIDEEEMIAIKNGIFDTLNLIRVLEEVNKRIGK